MTDALEPTHKSVLTPAQEDEMYAYIVRGERASRIAKTMGIPYGLVAKAAKRVTKELGIEGATIIQSRLVEYIDASLEAQITQQRLFGDEEWLRSQNAADLTRLQSSLLDNSLRLLEAIERAGAHVDAGSRREDEQSAPQRRTPGVLGSGSEDTGGTGETPETPPDRPI